MTTPEAAPAKKDVVPSQYRDKYKATGGTCGDFIAVALQKVAKDGEGAIGSVKAENNIPADRWATFNPGMQRMNLANVLRGMFLKGETITILGKEYNAKDQIAHDFNGTAANDPKTLERMIKFLDLQHNDRTVKAMQNLFFPVVKGKTDEQKAEEKAARDKVKADAKAVKDAAAKAKKATAAVDKAKAAEVKAGAALDAANHIAKEAVKALKHATDEDRDVLTKALQTANEKAGKAEEKHNEAVKAVEAATAAAA